MVQARLILIIWFFVLGFSGFTVQAESLQLDQADSEWLEEHRGETFTLGLDPFLGMDYFEFKEKQLGYMNDVIHLIEAETGIKIRIVPASWSKVIEQFEQGNIDILFGANPTPERLKTMVFSTPITKNPYNVYVHEGNEILTLGDLDGKRVGFIKSDYVIDKLKETYPQICFTPVYFKIEVDGFLALTGDEVDCFITSGGGVKYDYLYHFPDIWSITELPSIYSEMTLATLKDKKALCHVLDAVIKRHAESTIDKAIQQANVHYNLKVLNLTEKELAWLERGEKVIVGMSDDYLPFDYIADGRYSGIIGAYLDKMTEMTGIHFEVKQDAFSNLYQEALTGKIDILNVAKTSERQSYFSFTPPLGEDRDIIIGKKDSPIVQDVYGLEGKRIAVIEGFWHEEYLRKNLRKVDIVLTKDLPQSLKLLNSGKVDYVIENPTVAEFYIDGLGYNKLTKKGITSSDSLIYLGISKRNPELAGIFGKVLPLISFEEMKYKGLQSVPVLRSELTGRLIHTILILICFILCLVFFIQKTLNKLMEAKINSKILNEREQLLYHDSLTGLYNRAYFMKMSQNHERGILPQGVLIADLNNLKAVNDTWGHQKGDMLLTTFGEVLKRCIPGGVIFRMGGDEFMVLVPMGTAEKMEELIQTIQSSCLDERIKMDEMASIRPCVAMGWSLQESSELPLENAINDADAFMYGNKHDFKNRRMNCWTYLIDEERRKGLGCVCEATQRRCM